MSNIVILAGGLNTRFKDLQRIPKILLPTTKSSSILLNDCKVFENDSVYLVITDKYFDMVKNYIEVNKLSNRITLIKSKLTGSSYTTLKEVQEFLPDKDVLFVWSDLILNFRPEISEKNEAVIYTNSNGKYRYLAKDGSLTEVKDFSGNVAGMYYLRDLGKFKQETEAYPDLVDFIAAKYSNFITIEHSVDEYRDLEMFYEKYGKNKVKPTEPRFFNKFTKEGNVCTKACINNQFYHLIDKEISWYNIVGKDKKFIPRIFETSKENHYIKMEYLSGYIPFYQWLSEEKDPEKRNQVFDLLFKQIEEMHQIKETEVPVETLEKDYEKEVVSKVIDRLESIKHCILDYDYNEVNNLLNKAYMYALYQYPTDKVKYSFIHGDLNGSNVMVSTTDPIQIKFIDPRGYFGNTVMAGVADYDYAKLLYCLYGYDSFNNGEYIYYNNETYDIPPLTEDIPAKLNTPFNHIMVGVIYVALAQYIANDILKANIAYQYGIKLLKKELEK